jgi:hypothetical protein
MVEDEAHGQCNEPETSGHVFHGNESGAQSIEFCLLRFVVVIAQAHLTPVDGVFNLGGVLRGGQRERIAALMQTGAVIIKKTPLMNSVVISFLLFCLLAAALDELISGRLRNYRFALKIQSKLSCKIESAEPYWKQQPGDKSRKVQIVLEMRMDGNPAGR